MINNLIFGYKELLLVSIICLLSFSNAYAQREVLLNSKFEKVQNLYESSQYEIAYDSLQNFYNAYYNTLNEDKQIKMLDMAIRLSFLSEDWQRLDQFIEQYYALDPYFSAEILSESSEQLKEYISNFVRTKNEQFVFVNKHRQNIDLIPATVTVYTREDIDRLGARNILDLLRITPGFVELGDNNERMVGTRGSSGTTLQDILFLINGHRISDVLTNTNAPDWISLDYVEQIELMRGPGSALYGGSAFSGVVNIITRNGGYKNFSEVKVNLGTGNDFQDLSRENNVYHVNYQLGRKISNTEGLYISTSFYQSGGSEIDYSSLEEKPILPDSNGVLLRSADLNGKEYINKYAPGYNILFNYNRESFRLTANAQSSTFIYARPSSLNLWNSFDQDSLRQQRRRTDKRNFVQAEYDFLDKTAYSYNQLRLKVSADHFFKDFTTNPYSYGVEGLSRLRGNEYRATIDVEFSSDSLFKGFSKRKNHFLIGAQAFFNHWLYNYYTEADCTLVLNKIGDQFTDVNEDRYEYIAAGFIQTEHHLIEDRLIATTGIRFNYHNIYSVFDKFEWGEEYSPRFALLYLPKKNKYGLNSYKFKLLYNSAFLPPPFLYRRGGINQFVGNDSLKSQSIESGELVIYGDISKKFSYSALTYINKIDESIIRQGDTYINQPAEIRTSGYEAELKYKSSSETIDWYSFLNYSFTKQQKFKDSLRHSYSDVFKSNLFYEGDSLKLFPAAHVNAGFNIALKKRKVFNDAGDGLRFEKFAFGANIQWIGSAAIETAYFINGQGMLETTTQAELRKLPAAFVANVNFKVHTNKFSIGASIFNLANQKYFLPSAIYATQRQRAEGRMIYLNFNYFLNP
jgi:outer membrane receptor for ferrienterochelin and colicin